MPSCTARRGKHLEVAAAIAGTDIRVLKKVAGLAGSRALTSRRIDARAVHACSGNLAPCGCGCGCSARWPHVVVMAQTLQRLRGQTGGALQPCLEPPCPATFAQRLAAFAVRGQHTGCCRLRVYLSKKQRATANMACTAIPRAWHRPACIARRGVHKLGPLDLGKPSRPPPHPPPHGGPWRPAPSQDLEAQEDDELDPWFFEPDYTIAGSTVCGRSSAAQWFWLGLLLVGPVLCPMTPGARPA